MSTHVQRLIRVAMLTASLSALAPGDVIIEYDTGHPLGPHFLTIGEATQLRISVVDTTGKEWRILAVMFDFSAPIADLTWDLNGPDDIDFTEDDDFTWESCLDGFSCFYNATIDPPFTFYADFIPDDAVLVPPNGTVLLATLRITGTSVGEVTLDTGLGAEDFGMYSLSAPGALEVEGGTERAELTVVALGDGDGDGDSDFADFGLFQGCFTGDTGAGIDGACLLFDFDSDGDIDLDDYAEIRDAATSP